MLKKKLDYFIGRPNFLYDWYALLLVRQEKSTLMKGFHRIRKGN